MSIWHILEERTQFINKKPVIQEDDESKLDSEMMQLAKIYRENRDKIYPIAKSLESKTDDEMLSLVLSLSRKANVPRSIVVSKMFESAQPIEESWLNVSKWIMWFGEKLGFVYLVLGVVMFVYSPISGGLGAAFGGIFSFLIGYFMKKTYGAAYVSIKKDIDSSPEAVKPLLKDLYIFYLEHKADIQKRSVELQTKTPDELREIIFKLGEKSGLPREELLRESVNEGFFADVVKGTASSMLKVFGSLAIAFSVVLFYAAMTPGLSLVAYKLILGGLISLTGGAAMYGTEEAIRNLSYKAQAVDLNEVPSDKRMIVSEFLKFCEEHKAEIDEKARALRGMSPDQIRQMITSLAKEHGVIRESLTEDFMGTMANILSKIMGGAAFLLAAAVVGFLHASSLAPAVLTFISSVALAFLSRNLSDVAREINANDTNFDGMMDKASKFESFRR